MPNLRFQVSLEPQSFHRVCQGQRAKLQHQRQDSRVRGEAFLHILNLRQGTCLSSLKKHLEATWLRLEKGTQEETRFLPLREHRLPLGGIRRNRTRLKAPCRAAEQTRPATSVPLPRAEAAFPQAPCELRSGGHPVPRPPRGPGRPAAEAAFLGGSISAAHVVSALNPGTQRREGGGNSDRAKSKHKGERERNKGVLNNEETGDYN